VLTDPLIGMLLGFVVAFVATGWVRQYAIDRRLLDVPNVRSSHAVPTPRGGGLAMVLSFGILLLLQVLSDGLDSRLAFAVLPGVLAVAAVGLRDDHCNVSASRRLLVHAGAAVWAVYWLGGELTIPLPQGPLAIGWPGYVLILLAIMWFLNLFNFMDGIDGIAAAEAAFIAFAGAWLSNLSGQYDLVSVLLVLGAAALGFLVWNWPPAKIFMGDVGSGFLGAALGILGLAAVLADPNLLWSWLILPGVFVTDASVTLARRFLRGERWLEAHCCHAYQRAARRWGHARVTLGVLCINAAWLLPFALLAANVPQLGAFIVLGAYTPLLILALRLDAGGADHDHG